MEIKPGLYRCNQGDWSVNLSKEDINKLYTRVAVSTLIQKIMSIQRECLAGDIYQSCRCSLADLKDLLREYKNNF